MDDSGETYELRYDGLYWYYADELGYGMVYRFYPDGVALDGVVSGIPRGNWFDRDSGHDVSERTYTREGNTVFILIETVETCGDYGIFCHLRDDYFISPNPFVADDKGDKYVNFNFYSFDSIAEYYSEDVPEE